jgi:hypothetical protein
MWKGIGEPLVGKCVEAELRMHLMDLEHKARSIATNTTSLHLLATAPSDPTTSASIHDDQGSRD